jgi:hypothetical protein
MSNLQFTRPGGVWNTDTDLLAAELADFDGKTVRAVSGDGGTYYLLDPLVIGGAAGTFVEFSADVTFDRNAYFDASAIFNDQVYVGPGSPMEVVRDATFYANVRIDGELTCNGDLNADGEAFFTNVTFHYGPTGFYDNVYFELGSDPIFEPPTTFNSSITVAGGCTVAGALVATGAVVTFVGHLFANGNVNLGDASTDTVRLRGSTQLEAVMTPVGDGRILETGVIAPNADATFDIRKTRHIFIEFTTETRTYTIDGTDLRDGDWFIVDNKSDNLHAIVGAVGGAVTSQSAAKFIRVLGSWKYTQWTYNT